MRRALAGLVAAALAAGPGCSRVEREPAATSLIGLDGADWRIALPLIRQGKLPVLAALRQAGAAGTMLTNADYRWSPVLWTSIATGRLPDAHGVTSFMTRVEGFDRLLPTPSTSRKCRALWNIFSERERTVGFVGWWCTWPAEPVHGFLVTDHFSATRFGLGPDFEGEVDERFTESQTWPEELAVEIASLVVDRRSIGREDFALFADLQEGFVFPEQFAKFDKPSEFAIAHAVDRTHFGAARKLLEERRPELFGVFFEGIDILQHYFWEFMDPAGSGTAPSAADVAAFGQAIERYYAWTDGLVGQLVDAGGEGRAILLVSDHGFRPSTERWPDKGISGEHRRQSFFLFAGPGVRRGVPAGDVDAVDVAPTLISYHGLPLAKDLDGEARTALLTDTWLAAHAAEPVATYETGPWERGKLPAASAAADLEERIRALGYIE
ncbi:MAG: alkaline phosphatase family protein [Candidatus Eiseniibacteriota bacterium]